MTREYTTTPTDGELLCRTSSTAEHEAGHTGRPDSRRRKGKMQYRKLQQLGAALVAATVAVSAVGGAQAASDDDTITIGWTSWADAEFVKELVKQQVEERTSNKVDLKMTSIGVQYQAVAKGEIDGMVMGWFPETHKKYWKKIHDQVVDLGPMYNGAKLGWVVPDYVSEDDIDSIKDLKKDDIADKVGGKIQGIDPGAGLMQLSGDAMEDYDLKDDYNLEQASDSAMTAALAKAIKSEDPIVVTLWTPHWAFGQWDLRFLDDPEESLGGAEHIDAVVRKDFREDHPKVAKFLSNLHIPLDKLQEAMYNARETSSEEAVDKFVEDNQDMVDSWWFGTGVEDSHGGEDADVAE